MSEEILIRQGAPTLAGIKTGSLFPCPCENREALLADIRRLNWWLSPKGSCLLPLRFLAGRVLLYQYRPAGLRRDLLDAQASELLRQAGYGDDSCALCGAACTALPRERRVSARGRAVSQLSPEDVRGFIDHRANGFKCAGLWKVYGNEEKARSLFAKYKKCTEIYCALWQSGSKLEQLAVAV